MLPNNLFPYKGDQMLKNETAIFNTANTIRRKAGIPDATSLEEAVSTVVMNITMDTKMAVFKEDFLAKGSAPDQADYLIPSIVLGMLITDKLWLIFDKKFDGGAVARSISSIHCMEKRELDADEVFRESAIKYTAIREFYRNPKLEEFNKSLLMLIFVCLEDTDRSFISSSFKPIYFGLRDLCQ